MTNGPWVHGLHGFAALGSPVTGNVPSRGIRDTDHIGLAKASPVRRAALIGGNGELLNDLTRDMPKMLADTMVSVKIITGWCASLEL